MNLKADPTSVSKAMRRAKHTGGSSIFDKCDYLTPPQIAGFFSRLSAKKTYSRDQPGHKEELERHELETEKAIEEMTSEVMKTFALQHPIMYEKYTCEIVCQSKLSVFNTNSAKDLCRPRIRCCFYDWQTSAALCRNYGRRSCQV